MLADACDVTLPPEPRAPGRAPWNPTLRQVFNRERRVAHEELLAGLMA
jgi:hypothetical protein